MTHERSRHVVAITLLVAALVAGGVSWVLEGTAFWVACGLAMVFLVAGIFAAGRAGSPQRQDDRGRR